MPSEAPVLPTQTEKPHHYTYLKEFRTQQCPLFLQHKCTQHRPFTCFHWHFMNQRRRRPVRKRDGTFSYSADVYCAKFDETAGSCPEGDECPYLHRSAGDTERRYHLRYYKTGTCVHETDARGCCIKNGAHCAFAHGANDLRPPVYDIRELQLMEQSESASEKSLTSPVGTPASLEKERILTEDPKWNDTNYVLANYKTEQCKRPPRLCRQGYACPSYHNSRDRRRSPKKSKYRSTPCPNVKHGDDWGDPSLCENGDLCTYCHTRTEQQFHPEIYKSSKCNDMVQTAYCPRGAFCAFAHVEQEMAAQRDMVSDGNSLAAFLSPALPDDGICDTDALFNIDDKQKSNSIPQQLLDITPQNGTNRTAQLPIGKERASSVSSITTSGSLPPVSNIFTSFPEPIGKGRSSSTSSSVDTGFYSIKSSFEGQENQSQLKLRQQIIAIDNDYTLDVAEKTKRKQNLVLLHSLSSGSLPHGMLAPSGGVYSQSSTMSPHATPFFPPADSLETAFDDLIVGDDFDLTSIDKELEKDTDANSVTSSVSAGLPNSYVGATSGPMNIPGGNSIQRGSIGSLSQESPSSSLGSLPPPFVPQLVQQQQKQEQRLEQAAAAFLSQPNPGKYAVPGFADFNSMSPRSTNSGGASSPMISTHANEVTKLKEELVANKAKLQSWEEGITQARGACEAWKKEATLSKVKAKTAEEEKNNALIQRDEAITQVSKLKQQVDQLSGGPHLRCLKRVSEMDILSLPQLKQLQQQLRQDLDTLDKIVYQHTAMKCIMCQDRNRSVAVMPCNHYVLCDPCASISHDCPYCHVPITKRSSIVLPL